MTKTTRRKSRSEVGVATITASRITANDLPKLPESSLTESARTILENTLKNVRGDKQYEIDKEKSL
jgi:hypothetical protein